MFRFHKLEVFRHPTLGHLDIDFYPEKEEIKKQEEPFTSVVIGMNGTGKSFILKTIADIFYQLEKMQDGKKRDEISFAFYLKYSFYKDTYEIYSSRWLTMKSTSQDKTDVSFIHFSLNRPKNVKLYNTSNNFAIDNGYLISIDQLILPTKVIASTSQVNDRFTFKKDDESNIYKYCGLKHTPRNISSNAFKRKIASSLLEAIGQSNFKDVLNSTIVDFLDFDPYLSINFRTKYTARFFKNDLNITDLEDFYIKYEEKQIRNTEPWGAWKFKQLLENKNLSNKNQTRLDDIIGFVKDLLKNNFLDAIKNSDSKKLRIDFFSDKASKIDYSLINDLIQLDILYVENIEIRKKGRDVTLDQVSAGENQIIMSLLRMLSNIQENSLVLIDEPELSLHPNWQMKYIHLLKKMFNKFPDSHFIIATHSHFLISDLEKHSSSVIEIKRENQELSTRNIEFSTYGMSAEEILYSVFKLRTTRNYYFEYDLSNMVSLINQKSDNFEKIRIYVDKFEKLTLSKADPLNELIRKAKKYLLENAGS